MPTEIYRDRVQDLVMSGGQLLDVLSATQYEDVHLAGAMNIPLSELDQKTTAQLQKDRPVITYCHDYQ